MFKTLNLPYLNHSQLAYMDYSVYLEEINSCPYCSKEISPTYEYGAFKSSSNLNNAIDVANNGFVVTLYSCPNCKNGIVVKYDVKFTTTSTGYLESWKEFTVNTIYPNSTAIFPFDDIVTTVSKRFTDIYTQSLQAKLENKNELVGIGYRKSIEFLIKDYLIHIRHEKYNEVPKMHLGDCLKLIDNPKIQDLAKASTWLGNDETHYVRKHSNKDISDLERFLTVLVNYLSFELVADEAASFINK